MYDNEKVNSTTVEHETFPHESLYKSITHLEERSLAALIELRQRIHGESEGVVEDEEVNRKGMPSLEYTLKNSSERLHKLNEVMYNEINKIHEALFLNDDS